MADEWLTYSDLGERLGISSEAVRQRAIRYRWRRRMNNYGKTEVLVDLVDVKEQLERFPPRKPKDEEPSDERPTPDEQASDTRTFEALEAHIQSLKDVLAKAEAVAERERLRADEERSRADTERGRADKLQTRVTELLEERASAARRTAEIEAAQDRHVAELNAVLDQAKAHDERVAELQAENAVLKARRWWRFGR